VSPYFLRCFAIDGIVSDSRVLNKAQGASPLTVDWQGAEGKEFVQGTLQAVYEQLEAGK
jgi:hypothetical protein